MTTIAIDIHGNVAVDGLVTEGRNSTIDGDYKKFSIIDDLLILNVGDSGKFLPLLEIFKDFKIDMIDSFWERYFLSGTYSKLFTNSCKLIIYNPKTKTVLEFYKSTEIVTYHKHDLPIAFGAGYRTAFGILALNLPSEHAVLAASIMNQCTGGSIYHFDFYSRNGDMVEPSNLLPSDISAIKDLDFTNYGNKYKSL